MGYLKFDTKADWIAASHKRLLDAYNLVEGAETPIIDPSPEKLIMCHEEREKLDNCELMLDDCVRWVNALGKEDCGWPPFINTYCTIAMIPEAFGAKVGFAKGGIAWADIIIDDIKKVYELKPVPINTSPMLKRQTEWIDVAQRKLGTDLPIWIADIQSPFSVAAQIVDHEELFIACYTNPKAVHHLCRMITDYSIEVMKTHLKQIENPGFPGRNFPSISENIGICIADDTPLVMLSPEMYREFAMPYNVEIGKHFGGVHYHSCGDYHLNLDNLLSTPNIRSIQAHLGVGEFPMPYPDDAAAFNRMFNKVACLLDFNDIARGDEYSGRDIDHFKEYFIPRLKGRKTTGMILQIPGWREFNSSQDARSFTKLELQAISV